ncbi:adenylosuccinate lyase [Metarhizium acridum CQMa 102]|uniref:Adenylosuccinate lyase n=1 Tax=Metarhizium acridum (strain CQMa 102) TaxID=655827 RepID=E9DRF1_METAQ|nr:adenylosuccinate lyase [Metarhizium acridum CQMa 102]EFY93829.1 adenylosuccinate lyase [Metarhizium acridum CQMa 102]
MATDGKDAGPSPYDTYQTSLTTRYCSPEMARLFGQRSRHSQWRRLWLLLAESERELGIQTITTEALEQMERHLEVTDQDFELARAEEKIRRHDVMAHVHAFGAVAPAAAGIIHYGPGIFPCYHEIVGKRAAQWAQDLVFDLESIEHVRNGLLLRGAQGTTGTQASFLEIFGGDGSKCDQLNALLCKKTGFPACYDVSTQTYTRKVDLLVANAICGLGATAQKIAGDIRHLASWQEAEEPFEVKQVGSSAMPFKRNPMRSERVSSLARELLSKQATTANTLAAQWMERSLDDSAVRRMDLPEMFLLADAIIGSLDNITDGMVIYPKVIASRVQEQLPFMCAENIIMKLCAKGISRQEAHEQIRVLSHQAAGVVKLEGKPNDLIDRIKATEFFQPIWADLDDMLRPELYIGRSIEIVERYCGLEGIAEKKIQRYRAVFEKSGTTKLNV